MLVKYKTLVFVTLMLVSIKSSAEAYDYLQNMTLKELVKIFECIVDSHCKKVTDEAAECPKAPNILSLAAYCRRYVAPHACNIYEQYDEFKKNHTLIKEVHDCIACKLCKDLDKEEKKQQVSFEKCIKRIASKLHCDCNESSEEKCKVSSEEKCKNSSEEKCTGGLIVKLFG